MTGHGKNPWADAVLKVRGKLVNPDAGIVLLRDEGNEISLEGVSDIIETVGLLLSDGGGLNVDANPAFEAWNPPEEKKFVWTVTPGAGKSGHIKLLLISREGEPISWEISCRVLSSNLSDEADVMLDGTAISPDGENFIGGATRKITMYYKNGYVLKDIPLTLDVIPVAGVETSDFQSNPSLGDPSVAHQWEITPSEKYGSFKFKLATAAEGACLVSSLNRLEPSVNFRFIDLLDRPLPFPPELTTVHKNLLYAAGVVLKTKDDEPMVDVPIIFRIPEHEVFSAKTGVAGKAAAGLVKFTTVGKRELSAVASLPSGDVTVEAWINVV